MLLTSKLQLSILYTIVGIATVFVWKGVWSLMDLTIFPSDFTKSAWVSMLIGFIGAMFNLFVIDYIE